MKIQGIRRRNKIIFVFITLGLLIFYSNKYSSYIKVYTEGLFVSYHFETKDCQFRFMIIPSKGRDIQLMEKKFEDYIKDNNLSKDNVILYRTFRRNPLKFWLWHEYYNHDIYMKYDYKSKCK